MRIAQVAPLTESVPPKRYGGTERVVSYLTEELVRLGHEVTLFATGDSITSARLVPGCKEGLRSSKCRDPLAHHFAMLEEVLSQKDQFDIVHFHIDYLHYPFSRREKLVNVTTLHGRLDLEELQPLYRRFPDLPLVSISDAQRDPVPWANWQATVYHGIPEGHYSLHKNAGKYLAFLGRVSPEKGLDQAIEIATRAGIPIKVAAKVDRVDQEYFETVIRPLLRNPLVEYLGELGYPEKSEFLGNALALLFPINWPEPFGLAMIEAMACGTPVIAYPFGSVPEVVEEGRTGFMVPNADAAVKALQHVTKLCRCECREAFQKRFSAARMVQDYLAVYKRLIRGEPELLSVNDGVSVG